MIIYVKKGLCFRYLKVSVSRADREDTVLFWAIFVVFLFVGMLQFII